MEKLEHLFGEHYIVEFIECDAEILKYAADIKKILIQAAEASKATILESFFHQFDPVGVSGVILIAESHFSIHTWPEAGYASFDIQTCGSMDPQAAIDIIKQQFKAAKVNVKVVQRGY